MPQEDENGSKKQLCQKVWVKGQEQTGSSFRERMKVHLNMMKNLNIFSEYSFHKQSYLQWLIKNKC